MTEMGTTPERDPDEDVMLPHFDEEEAEYVDIHGPAFRTSYLDDADESTEQWDQDPPEEPPDG